MIGLVFCEGINTFIVNDLYRIDFAVSLLHKDNFV